MKDIWGRDLRGEPKPVASFIDALLAKVTTPGGAVMLQLVSGWDQLAGREWAGRSKPISLRKGVLVVQVADGPTASVLRFQLAALQHRLNGRFGPDTVLDVQLRVGRPPSLGERAPGRPK